MSADGWGNANLGLDRRFGQEWLETDGLGGYASGTAGGIRTRRYHALLLTSLRPPTHRLVLVNGFEATVQFQKQNDTPEASAPKRPESQFLTSQYYWPDVIYPRGIDSLQTFTTCPWPQWTFHLPNGPTVKQELFVPRGKSAVFLRWSLDPDVEPNNYEQLHLQIRPLISGRDYHALHRENSQFRFDPVYNHFNASQGSGLVEFQPYTGLPTIRMAHNGQYTHQPDWYRNFLYLEERSRGLDCIEDLASPGILTWNLKQSPALWLLTPGTPFGLASPAKIDEGLWTLLTSRELQRRCPVPAVRNGDTGRASQAVHRTSNSNILAEKKTEPFSEEKENTAKCDSTRCVPSKVVSISTAGALRDLKSQALQSVEAYLARRNSGLTILAGYPWFTDWGRDTFISVRGLCLATGRLGEARQILLDWARCVSHGMLPNRFPDAGSEPEFNSVDASLWFVIAAYELIQAAETTNVLSDSDEDALVYAISEILLGYRQGTRFGIRCDTDGLLSAGEAGLALTWMDARVDSRPVTPRIGKPVEIQALWINALRIGEILTNRAEFDWRLSQQSFAAKFWRNDIGYLADVIDVNHVPGQIDISLRPNQLLAVGGLPFRILDDTQASSLLTQVEQSLLTPVGLRTLAPDHPDYQGRYQGGVAERDRSYHQGTVWPWLLGPFVEAWVQLRGATIDAKRIARERFLNPLIDAFATPETGLTHLPEIADGEAPHQARGCPFQAWSLGEALRLDLQVLNHYTHEE